MRHLTPSRGLRLVIPYITLYWPLSSSMGSSVLLSPSIIQSLSSQGKLARVERRQPQRNPPPTPLQELVNHVVVAVTHKHL